MVSKKDKYLAAAQKFLERGQIDKALAEFGKVVQEDPKDTRTWLKMGELYAKRGDSPKATEIYLKTAELYTEQGFLQKAVAVYKNVLKLSPGYVQGHFKLAGLFKQLGHLQDAQQQYEVAAAVHDKAGRAMEALDALRQIVEINPDNVVSRIKLAEKASQAGAVDDAIREFGRAAQQLKGQGRTDEYLKVSERLLFHQQDNLVLAKELAEVYVSRNNAKFALPKLQACFKADPRDPATLSLLARAFEQLGQVPKSVSVLKELARLCHDKGRTAERNEAVRKLMALDAGDAEGRDLAVKYGLIAALGGRVPGEVAGTSAATRVSRPPAQPQPQAPVPVPGPAPPYRTGRAPAAGFNELGKVEFQEALTKAQALVAEVERREVEADLEAAAGAVARYEDDAEIEVDHDGIEQANLDVQRIITESEVFVKYGLLERAADHLRKVFEIQPRHFAAKEKLVATLVQLGRISEAVAEIETMAEQRAVTEPRQAAELARRALALDPRSVRAEGLLRLIEAGQEQASTDEPDPMMEAAIDPVVEVDAPIALDGDVYDGSDEAAASEPALDLLAPEPFTGGEPSGPLIQIESEVSTSLAPPPEIEDRFGLPDDDGVNDFVVSGTSGEPAVELVPPSVVDQGAALLDAELAGGQQTSESAFDLDQSTPHRPAEPAAAVAEPVPEDLMSDLEQVDFFVQQGLHEEARSLLVDLGDRYPGYAEVSDKLAVLDEAAGAAAGEGGGEGAIPGTGSGAGADAVSFLSGGAPRVVLAEGEQADMSTHKDLGIAYKEMGLFDPAIGEFELLFKDPRHEVFSTTMIGECHEAKGDLTEAVAHYKKALNCATVTDQEMTLLYYHLGSVYERLGDAKEALFFYEKVWKRDPKLKDVAQKLAALRTRPRDVDHA